MPVPTSTGVAELEEEAPGRYTLYVDGVPSSCVDLEDPTRLEFEYMQQMACLIDTLPEGPLRVVHLGAAGCSLARCIDAQRPGSRQIGVDLDEGLLTLARSWFDLPRSPRLRLRVGDARQSLDGMRAGSADVIVRDVFSGGRIPESVRTWEFDRQALRVLAPGGILLANMVGRPPLRDVADEVATALAATRPPGLGREVALIAEPGVLRRRRYGNVVLAVLPRGLDDSWMRRVRSLPAPARALVGPELERLARGATVLRDQGPDGVAPLP